MDESVNRAEIEAMEVTQEDREAAAVFSDAGHSAPAHGFGHALRSGRYDQNSLTQAFARHRIRALSTQAPMPGEVGELVASMQALSNWLVANDVDMKLPDECGDPAQAAALIQSLQREVERLNSAGDGDVALIHQLTDQLTAAQRVKDEAVGHIENLTSDGHGYESEGMARQSAIDFLKDHGGNHG